MREKTKVRAQNKWRGILSQLGLTPKELSGKHTSCPSCGGVDRFRFTDYKGGGEYFCSSCGPGGGLDLLMKKFGWSFIDAAKEVDRILGDGVEETFQPKIDIEKRRRDLNMVWAEAKYFGLVQDYLSQRRIKDYGTGFKDLTDLRGTNELYDTETGRYAPGMVALIRNKVGEPISIHRTYFDPRAKKIMPPTEKITGGGIRLGWGGDDNGTLVVGEGIETTVAGMSDYGCAGLAAISAHGMEEIIIPKQFYKIIILADHDASFTGQKAALTLARKCDHEGRTTKVIMPADRGDDYLDCHRLSREGLRLADLTLYFENEK